jgi:Prokaryotic diacylglycerol kinase
MGFICTSGFTMKNQPVPRRLTYAAGGIRMARDRGQFSHSSAPRRDGCRLHPEQHPAIRTAKDCAAAAVLRASISALLIGLLTLAVGLHLLDHA